MCDTKGPSGWLITAWTYWQNASICCIKVRTWTFAYAYTQLDRRLLWALDLTTSYQDLSVQLRNSSREKFTPFQKEILLEFSSSNQAILQSASKSHFRVLKIAFSLPPHYYHYPTVTPKSFYKKLSEMFLKAVLSQGEQYPHVQKSISQLMAKDYTDYRHNEVTVFG